MEFKKYLEERYSYQPEFVQAVEEVYEDVEDLIEEYDPHGKDNLMERLIEPDRIIRFRVSWMDDSGNIQVNRGWRVQFSNVLGPYKGGLRFHPTVNTSVLKFLAFEQCFKNALTGLPMGGGKGGSDFDPKGKSENEIMRFCHAFMEELYKYIGNHEDIPAGDIGVSGTEIGWMFGHYLKITNDFAGVITGKRPSFGGSCGREEATGYGLIYLTEEILKAHDQGWKDKRVIISGAGNVSLNAAEKATQEGAKVVTLSDSRGLLVNKDGFSMDEIHSIKIEKGKNRGTLENWKSNNSGSKAEYHKGKEPWGVEADIALPCATQNEVDKEEAKTLASNGVKVIAEGANMPLTAEAIEIAQENNIIYAPGKAANAGGVAVSGLERTQNSQYQSWKLERVDQELKQIMAEIHDKCAAEVKKENGIYNYKKGANRAGFRKVAEATIALGVK
jgi:glutamate dehydrogenase (NADP+)